MPAWINLLAGSGTIIGVAWVVFQFIRWAIEFSCTRLDRRDEQLSEREADVEDKMERWRRSMERDFRALKVELGHYRTATNLLVGELHRQNPLNSTLAMVDQILAPYRVVPVASEDPDADLLREIE